LQDAFYIGIIMRGGPRIFRWEGMMTFWQIEMLRSDVAYIA